MTGAFCETVTNSAHIILIYVYIAASLPSMDPIRPELCDLSRAPNSHTSPVFSGLSNVTVLNLVLSVALKSPEDRLSGTSILLMY